MSLIGLAQVNHEFYSYVKKLKDNNSIVYRINILRWLCIFPNSQKIHIIDNIFINKILGSDCFDKYYLNIEEIKIENMNSFGCNLIDKFPNLRKIIFIGVDIDVFKDIYYKMKSYNENIEVIKN